MALLHIEFKDGSNPYRFSGTEKSIENELRKWRRGNYITTLKRLSDGSLFVLAENKIEADRESLRNLFLGEEIPLF